MIDANSPTFRQRYPNGAIVYDRTGRRISGVVAFNPETGEVVRHGKSRIVGAILRMARGRQQHWDLPAEFWRHGFWPAPLAIRANWPLPPKHPMCRCVLELLPGDTVTVIGINGPNKHLNGSYAVTSVSHTTIPGIN
jgi:hypothetical protein